MAELIKILINRSGASLSILGRPVAHNGQYVVQANRWLEIIDDSTLLGLIDSGYVVVSDGSGELSAAGGRAHACRFENMGAAFFIPVFKLEHNGTISRNDWVTFSNLTPDAKLVIPHNLVVTKLTWSNNNSGINADWEVYKNGISGSNLCATLEFRDTSNDWGSCSCSMALAEGDWIRIKYVDLGNPNMQDLNAVLWGTLS